jgi:hypothetical protein
VDIVQMKVDNIICEDHETDEAAQARQLCNHILDLTKGFRNRIALNALTWALIATHMEVYGAGNEAVFIGQISEQYASMYKEGD